MFSSLVTDTAGSLLWLCLQTVDGGGWQNIRHILVDTCPHGTERSKMDTRRIRCREKLPPVSTENSLWSRCMTRRSGAPLAADCTSPPALQINHGCLEVNIESSSCPVPYRTGLPYRLHVWTEYSVASNPPRG
ncbi:hypothetical protein V8C43DRAFT_283954 [Trichoderma afarasin]